METLYVFSYYNSKSVRICHWLDVRVPYFCEIFLHDLRAVVDSQNDVSHASSCKSLDLVKNHALVAELNQWLWESEGL